MKNFKPNELEKRVDEVLYYVWDPIGVSSEPYARDEYLSYVGSILNMVNTDKSEKLIAQHLCEIESQNMGITPNKSKALETAEILKQHKKAIDEGCS